MRTPPPLHIGKNAPCLEYEYKVRGERRADGYCGSDPGSNLTLRLESEMQLLPSSSSLPTPRTSASQPLLLPTAYFQSWLHPPYRCGHRAHGSSGPGSGSATQQQQQWQQLQHPGAAAATSATTGHMVSGGSGQAAGVADTSGWGVQGQGIWSGHSETGYWT